MRLLRITIISVFLLQGTGFAQDIKPYIAMIERGQVDSVKAAYEQLAYQYPGSVAIRYLRALIESDATKSVAIYKDILRNHVNSEYAPDALMYLGEYYYAQGLFVQSQSVLKQLIRKHPDFPRLAHAVNLMLRGEIVAGAVDSARADLSWVRGIKPDLIIDIPAELKDVQPIQEARLELMELQSEQKAADQRPANRLGSPDTQSYPPPTKARYQLQCGAFSSQSNADLLASQVGSLGYDVSVERKRVSGKTLYVVLAGRFSTRHEAGYEADNIKNALGIDKPFPKAIDP
ncbi:MAG: SPOR domain-containing protein [Candidatus Marinimicrobia bacterium]|nr:SPOR domain-containing protein [Candidatus Neomarinimicrobiota bacterium]MCF7840241.1 SPOR domain-containing protein [Candidatus Neomarinimicrobiota bacterium]MCF7903173.1 SPOR domain-containing protein [Candidatus Neomarinimicrobiota bacterium]